MSYITKNCPNCGEELSIPENLENVICMYCGKSFVCRQTNSAELFGLDFDNELKLAYDTLSNEIILPRPNADVFTKKLYPPSFDHYCECFSRSLSHMDNAFALCADEKKEQVITDYGRHIADAVMSKIDQTKGRRNKMDARFLCARHLVAFTVPAVQKYSSDYSNMLSEAIVGRWNEKYKKHTMGIATFDEINQGFHDRYRFCYITTAVCDSLGKPDNCYELTTLRNFRDNYLANTPNGRQEIEEYYLFAPMILRRINDIGEYDRIWEQYIKPCISDIESGDNESCHKRYCDMVSELRQKWLAS